MYKYKKQLNKLKKQVGMVGPKSTQTRVVGTITNEIHPYTFFVETLLQFTLAPQQIMYMKNVYGCISSVTVPTTLVCVLFGPTIPTYMYFFNCFLYLFMFVFLRSIATESEGVWSSTYNLWHVVMCRH